MIHPVILSGGSGTRLWPMSRSLYPKQLLALTGERSLLQETARRVADAKRLRRRRSSSRTRSIVSSSPSSCARSASTPAALILEPFGRNTAPAACVAALRLVATAGTAGDPEPLMLVMPSDHAIGDLAAFRQAIERAAAAARAGHLVTFGITPERAETGYGYIASGRPLDVRPRRAPSRSPALSRSPTRDTAERYVASGEYFWNSGIFLFPAALYLSELERLQPDMLAACKAALAAAKTETDFVRLDKAAFDACPSDSIDYAVMEHTHAAAVVPVGMGWSDLGSWDALWEMGDKDERGNALSGNVVAEATRNCYLRSEAGLVAAIGVEDIVVVATDDAVMVAPRNRTQEVKQLVARLLAEKRDEADALPTVHRPWGSYRSLHNGHRVQVKHILVRPGGKLSLQMHHHRAEHWVVVQGTAKIVRGNEETILTEDQSTYIPLGTPHRLENPGKIPLHVIEVQVGSYLGEDDIVRFEDHYGRE